MSTATERVADPIHRPLTPAEHEFVKYYCFGDKRGNASAACLAAFSVKDSVAASYGAKVLARPHIQAAVARAQMADIIPMAQFWMELKKVVEQDKSYAAKVAGLRLKAEIDGLVKNKTDRKPKIETDPAVLEELITRIRTLREEENTNGK